MLTFIKTNFRWIAGGFTLTFFSSFGQTYFISASIAEWQAAFDLSHGEFGRLYMFATLASALSLPFIGRLVDSVAVHKMVAFVIPVLAGAAVVAGYTSSLTLLIVAIFLLRLFGQGMMTHIALTATGRWFVAQRGRAISLVVLGHQGGEATIPLAFSMIAIAYGYQTGWFGAAAALLLVGLPFAFWAYRQEREPQGSDVQLEEDAPKTRSWTRREVLRDPIFWVLLAGVLAPALVGTTVFYHQNYMTHLNDWPPQLFATSLVLLSAVTVGFALITGALVDRLGTPTIIPFALLPLAAACFALAYSGPPSSLYLVMVLLGISYGISMTLFGSLWPEIYGTDHLGSIRSVTVSVAVLATAAGPGLTGTLIDRGIELPTQMIYFGGYCLLAAAGLTLASMVLRKRSLESEQVNDSCA